MKTAVEDVQWRRAARLPLCAQRDADLGEDHARGFNEAHQHRQEYRKLWRHMVGTLGIGLAVRQAERTLVSAMVITVSRHVGTRFSHCRRRAAAFHLVAATGTGVRGRCQLNCQEYSEQEAGEDGMPASSVTQECFAVGVIVARILLFSGHAS